MFLDYGRKKENIFASLAFGNSLAIPQNFHQVGARVDSLGKKMWMIKKTFRFLFFGLIFGSDYFQVDYWFGLIIFRLVIVGICLLSFFVKRWWSRKYRKIFCEEKGAKIFHCCERCENISSVYVIEPIFVSLYY